MVFHVAEHGERIVQEEARAKLPERDTRAAVDRPRESERTHEVRRDAQQRSALAARLEHQMQMPMLEIPDATVHEARRAARRSAREVVSLDECGAESAHRRVARDAGAGDPAADHEHVELLVRESCQAVNARRQMSDALEWR